MDAPGSTTNLSLRGVASWVITAINSPVDFLIAKFLVFPCPNSEDGIVNSFRFL
jgi:hypothetical protein